MDQNHVKKRKRIQSFPQRERDLEPSLQNSQRKHDFRSNNKRNKEPFKTNITRNRQLPCMDFTMMRQSSILSNRFSI